MLTDTLYVILSITPVVCLTIFNIAENPKDISGLIIMTNLNLKEVKLMLGLVFDNIPLKSFVLKCFPPACLYSVSHSCLPFEVLIIFPQNCIEAHEEEQTYHNNIKALWTLSVLSTI